jgi:hypothetical protein
MFIAHSRPTDFAVAVVGTGAALVTDPAALFNGRPADPTRLRLPSSWTGVITEYVDLQFTRATAFVPGLVGLVGLNLLGLASSAGLKFSFMGKRVGDAGFTYSLGGNTALVRSYERGDGSMVALGKTDVGLDPIVGFNMRLWNDQNGVANLAASGYVDQGDAWASPGLDVYIDKAWEIDEPDDAVPVSMDGQPWPTPFPPGDTLPVTMPLVDTSDVFRAGSTPNFKQLKRLIGRGNTSIFIPWWKDASGNIDVELLHSTAAFGTCQLTKIAHTSGAKFGCSAKIKETPALLAQ